jgi:predicted SAM-dependent methyltransferase
VEIPVDGLRINVGCGGRRIPGYIGVDAVERSGADLIAPANKIPLGDGCADEVLAVHLVEHLVPWDLHETLQEWFRLLKPGGSLILEMPDLIKCCKNIIDGRMRGGKHPDQLGMWGLFGDDRYQDPYMLHRWSYTFKTLEPKVAAVGFVKIVERPTIFHPAGRDFRDFRLEAKRP